MNLHYKRYGEGHPLIILHGLFGDSGNWHTLSSRHFASHFQVLAVDQRNHGRSPHSRVFDYPVMADDLHRFMLEHDAAPAYLLGHSMGGKTAMNIALTYPDTVDKLVVVDIAPKPYGSRHKPIFEALQGLDPAAYTNRREIDAALAREIGDPGVRQLLLKNLEHDGEGAYRWRMYLDGIRRNYHRINVGLEADGLFEKPALFIRGGTSDYVAEEDYEVIRSFFTEAEFVTIPDAGHWVHAEAPEAFAEIVLNFLLR